MGLAKETKIGLTFGQIITVLSMLAAIAGVWIRVEVQLAEMNLRQTNETIDRIEESTAIKSDLKEHEGKDDKRWDTFIVKFDRVYDYVIKNQ